MKDQKNFLVWIKNQKNFLEDMPLKTSKIFWNLM